MERTVNSSAEVGAASPLEPADYQEFILHGRTEMLALLRSLCTAGDRVVLHFNEGRDALPSQVLAVGENSILLDRCGDPSANERALAASRVFAVTRHDRVHIQFALAGLAVAQHGDAPAFSAALPESMLRLQRREFYRLALPVDEALRCRIPTGGDGDSVAANIIDISGGGLAIIVPPAGLPLAEGMEFPNCRIELPEIGVVSPRLQVRTLFDLTLPSGIPVHRAGCRFVDLPGTMLALVQRYVLKAERNRKARSLGNL